MKRLRAWLKAPGIFIGKALAPIWHALRASWKAVPLRFLGFLGRAAWGTFLAVLAWCAGMNWRLLLQGLPALAAALVGATVLALTAFTPAHEIEARYRDKAQAALKAKDYTEAVVCQERLASLANDRPEALYELAIAAEAAGQPARCAQLMRQLAPADRQGFPKAHLWQAVRLMVASKPTLQTRQLAETHLLRAIEGGVEDKAAANGLLGDIYLSRGLLDQAEPYLLIAVKTRPQARLRLALLYAAQGNLERARSEAKQAANLFSTAAKADLFNHNARLRWAEANTFVEDFPQAIAILEEGWTGTGEQAYRAALAQTCVTWIDFLSRQGQDTAGQRLALLERGLHYDPKNIALLDRLLAIAGIKTDPYAPVRRAIGTLGLASTSNPWGVLSTCAATDGAKTEAAAGTLRRMLAEGMVAGQVHFALGVNAWERKNVKEARFHWERALQLNPDTPTIANNLAWLLLQTAPDDLQKALDLINLAIDKAPQEINFRGTRGHILAKIGKHKEAIADLEAVLPTSPNAVALHRVLAECYGKMELPAMAAEHEKRALEKGKKTIGPR